MKRIISLVIIVTLALTTLSAQTKQNADSKVSNSKVEMTVIQVPTVVCGSCVTTITKALKKKQAVTIVGFGTFKVGKRKARKGRNPQTGAEIIIVGRKVLTFKPSQILKKSLNIPSS